MNNTLANGMRVLDALAGRVLPSSVSELARELKLPKSHVHRLLQTLVAGGYAMQDEQRRYRVGLGVLRTANAVLQNQPVRQVVLPHLRAIADERNLDLALVTWHRDEAVIIAADYHRGRRKDPNTNVGRVLPLHATAAGKALLALLPANSRKAMITGLTLPALTPSTTTSRSALEKAVITVRRRGWAVNHGEHIADLRGLAAPLQLAGSSGGDFALTASATARDLHDEDLDQVGQLLLRQSAMIAAEWDALSRA